MVFRNRLIFSRPSGELVGVVVSMMRWVERLWRSASLARMLFRNVPRHILRSTLRVVSGNPAETNPFVFVALMMANRARSKIAGVAPRLADKLHVTAIFFPVTDDETCMTDEDCEAGSGKICVQGSGNWKDEKFCNNHKKAARRDTFSPQYKNSNNLG